MHVTRPLSRHYDADQVVEPERRGRVAWSLFNRHYARLQRDHWSHINRGTDHPFYRRWQRLATAWFVQRTGAILDLERKARIIGRFPLARDPDIVFFGAEVGWEAVLIQALFGAGGRVVLVDCDPEAYRRFCDAPRQLRVGDLVLERDPERIEYVKADFFDWSEPDGFDVGIDWGLLEHYPGAGKRAVLDRFAASLRPTGFEITAVPRDSLSARWFYRTFTDELNFGYRELMTPAEHAAALRAGGFEVVEQVATPTTCVALARPAR